MITNDGKIMIPLTRGNHQDKKLAKQIATESFQQQTQDLIRQIVQLELKLAMQHLKINIEPMVPKIVEAVRAAMAGGETMEIEDPPQP